MTSLVLKKEVVAKSLAILREQQIHATFAGYLCLQQAAFSQKRIRNLDPKFVTFFDRYYRVENHPIGYPYIRPFTEKRPSQENLWLNKNVAGSYALSSIRAGQPFSSVVDIAKRPSYCLFADHAERAAEHLLYGSKIPVTELAIFLFRDKAFGPDATVETLINLFASEFGYAVEGGMQSSNAFHLLYSLESAGETSKNIFERLSSEENSQSLKNTPGYGSRVSKLSANDLLMIDAREGVAKNCLALSAIRVEGLLSFREKTEFSLGRLTLLVGPNGSGKSNFIDCLRILKASPHDIQQSFKDGGFEAWLNNSIVDKKEGVATIEAVVHPTSLSHAVRHMIRLGPPRKDRAQLEEEISSVAGNDNAMSLFVGSYRSPAFLKSETARGRAIEKPVSGYDSFASILSQIRDADQYPEVTRLGSLYSAIRIYSEWSFGRSSKLREAAPTGRSDTQLSETMADLPVALNAMEKTAAHQKILKLLPELKPTYRDYVTRILFGKVGLEMAELPYETPIIAHRLSDGTLRFLALAAILLQPEPPPLVCIEEPELGMHPDMIRLVASMLMDATERTQLIVSTHSEDLLTALEDKFDVLFAFDAGGGPSIVRRLSQTDFKKWRSEHSLGELWSSGELGGVRY